jgi:hypothetical protein
MLAKLRRYTYCFVVVVVVVVVVVLQIGIWVFLKVVGRSFTEMFAANDWKPFQSCLVLYFFPSNCYVTFVSCCISRIFILFCIKLYFIIIMNHGFPVINSMKSTHNNQLWMLYGSNQRQETLDLPYLTLLCDNLKNRMFLQNFFSWPYFGNLLSCSSYPHHSTIPQPNNFIRDCRIRLLGQKWMFTAETSVFDLEVLFYSP